MILLLTIYFTGLIVCLIYGVTLDNVGYDPHGDEKWWQIILDEMFWPITLFGALYLSIVLKRKKK